MEHAMSTDLSADTDEDGDVKITPYKHHNKIDRGKGILTLREARILQSYWAEGSGGTKKTIRVGNKNVATSTLYTILRRPEAHQYLKELSEKALEDLKERRGRIIEELNAMAYSKITDIVDPNGSIVHMGADMRSVKHIFITDNARGRKVEVEMYDKYRALEALARISGLTIDRVDITSGGMPVSMAPVNITFEIVQGPRLTEVTVEDTGRAGHAFEATGAAINKGSAAEDTKDKSV